MTKQVPLRQLSIYRTDDGRCVEHFSKVKYIDYSKPPSVAEDEADENLEFNPATDLFIGVAQIMTNVGPKDIKFEIPADSIDQAFEKFHEFAFVAFTELQDRMRAQQSKIVQAPESVLNDIDRHAQGGGKIII